MITKTNFIFKFRLVFVPIWGKTLVPYCMTKRQINHCFNMVRLKKISLAESRGSSRFFNNQLVSDFEFGHFLKKCKFWFFLQKCRISKFITSKTHWNKGFQPLGVSKNDLSWSKVAGTFILAKKKEEHISNLILIENGDTSLNTSVNMSVDTSVNTSF